MKQTDEYIDCILMDIKLCGEASHDPDIDI